MHEPFAPTPVQTVIAFARVSAAVDAWSSAIAGFALLAGARAFTFIALLGWREPVLGGAGLVLLALIGWLRWQCGCAASAAPDAARDGGVPLCRVDREGGGAVVAVGGVQPRCAEARNVACYNRSSQCDVCDATRCSRTTVSGQARTQP
ncbi:hypothetical protein B0G69_5896 [Paraburkholderia sp. RAU2J]|nr:hypothetical protein [Paraburkholderia sp. RAU2J]RKT22436.1 hypothetical protein B0G69_5896 [Paraburkholderia sp. RAU2J]